MPIQSVNPADGALLRSFPALTPDAVSQKIGMAEIAFATYAEMPLTHRALCMRKLAYLMETETDDLAGLITTEMGKPIVEARAEIAKCAVTCRYYAENAARILAPEPIETGSHDVHVRWDPLGVILAVMPWNYPFWQVFRFLAPALMAGNVALLKHASNVPQCALAIEALVRRAGFPRGTFQTLLIESDQVEMVIGDPRVAAVTVTGSEVAGRAVASQAGWFLKKSVLELGGSDPFIVMPSADLDLAIEAAVKARVVNSGQSCIAAKRFLIADSIFDEFQTRFVAGMSALTIGDPTSEDTEIGPLATPDQVEKVEAQVFAMIEADGRLLSGGSRLPGKGNYFEPTVISGVSRTAAVYREEVFGPVAMLFRVRNAEEALEVANDTPFGLGASVWTKNPAEQKLLAVGLQCGAVFINAPVVSDPRFPFGGIKRSGYGRELSAAGMREFLNAKTVSISDSPSETEGDASGPALQQADSDQEA